MPGRVDIQDLGGKSPPDDGKGQRRVGGDTDDAPPSDESIRGRVESALERLAAMLEERGDTELAEVMRDEAPAMARGFVSATRPVRAFRGVLVGLLGLAEPMLAFGRVGRLMLTRLGDRRAARRAAAEAAEEGISE